MCEIVLFLSSRSVLSVKYCGQPRCLRSRYRPRCPGLEEGGGGDRCYIELRCSTTYPQSNLKITLGLVSWLMWGLGLRCFVVKFDVLLSFLFLIRSKIVEESWLQVELGAPEGESFLLVVAVCLWTRFKLFIDIVLLLGVVNLFTVSRWSRRRQVLLR